jgi:hypothetical protein
MTLRHLRQGRLCLHLPFDADYLGAGVYLATFGDTRAQMEAVVEVLLGEAKARVDIAP